MPQDDDDWLTRMGYEPSEIKPFHLGPTLGEHNDSIMMVMALHARERKRAKDEKRPQPPTPRLWFACSQHPRELIARWAMVPMTAKGWPTGFYESVAPAGPRAVSLSELPRDQSTLLLRLMGSDKTVNGALEDLEALPSEARERRIALPILVQLKDELPRMRVTVTIANPEEYKFMMSLEQAVRIVEEQEACLAGSLRWAQRQFERRLGRPLTETERATLTARFRGVGSERVLDVAFEREGPALAAWLADPDAR